MRFLDNQDEENMVLESKKAQEINTELVELGSRLSDLEDEVHADEQALQDYKDEPSIEKSLGKFTTLQVSGDTQAKDISAEDITANSVSASTGHIDYITSTDITADEVTADTGRIDRFTADDITTDSINAQDMETTNLKADSATVEDLSVTGILDIDEARISTFTITDATVSNKLTADKIEANQADIKAIEADDATVGFLEADANKLAKIQTHNIFYDQTVDPSEPMYIHIEPGDEPSETAYRILELPYFDTGDYYLSLRHPANDMAWWSVIVHNNHNNITVSYSRRTKDINNIEIPNPTLSEFYVYDYFGNAPKLYIKTYVGGNLYWQNQSLSKEDPPRMYNEYPFDVATFGALQYSCLHDGATWFTKHLDIIRAQSAQNASLFLIPSDWNNAERKQVEYNGMVDISWKYYIPNQPVNTTDEVTFRNVIINPLDGKWVYNKENALMGRNPETIDDLTGQLDGHDNLIETQELVKWNGKTGTTQENHTVVAGTIFRDQGYSQTSTHIYERRNPDSYDSVTWDDKQTRTDIVAVRRKSDWAIITSNPPIVGTYEDEEQIIWTDYRYVYPDIEGGQAYEEWIERTLPGGDLVHKLLMSTVDAELYINYTRFKEPFDYGDIDYNVNSYNNYHNQIEYVGDVVEGRWDAGDVHVTKKSTPINSAEPDYNGSLIVDGTTNLRDNVLVQDLNDPLNPANVDTIELHSDNYLNNAVGTDIRVSEAHNVTVGTALVPASETHTVYGDIDTHIEGESQLNVTGDTTTVIGTLADPTDPTSTNTQNTVTINSDNNVNLKGNTVVTYNELELVGHKKDAFDEDIPGSHLLIRDDVTIGQADDRHDLTVHGKLNVDAMAFIGDPGDNMRIRDIGTVAEPNIVAVAEHCAECEIQSGDTTGKLLPEDKLITAEVIAQYDGTVKNATTADPTAPDTYPITNLGDETDVHGDLHVEETTQLDGNTTIGVAEVVGVSPEVPANLSVIGDADVKYKLTANRAEIADDLTVKGDHFVEHDLIVDKNATVHGDLVVDGTIVSTDEKSIVTSSDYAVLRKSKASGLSSTEKSGFVVHNYDGLGTNASLAIDNDGIFRIADNAIETVTNYTNKSYFNGTYYDGLTTSTATIASGALVSQDADNFSDCVYYSGSYYHYDNTQWYEMSLVSNVLTYDKTSPVTSAATITALEALTKYDLTYYRALSVCAISDNANQPILTRSEATDLWEGAPLIWDSTNEKAVPATASAPIKSKQALITSVDPITGDVSYQWGTAGSGAGAVLVLTTAEYNRRAAITDMDDDEYIPNNALVVITDAEDEYLYGEVEAVTP